MTPQIFTTEDVIRAARKVPAKNLKIIELANRLTGPDGKFDFGAIQDIQAEVNLARMEAVSYIRETSLAVDAIQKITPRAGDSL